MPWLFTSWVPTAFADPLSSNTPPPQMEESTATLTTPPHTPPLTSEPPESQEPLDTGSFKNLPDIEANLFPVKVLRKSKSGRIYLFEDSQIRQPAAGRLMLLKEDGNPIMAFRVLKTYLKEQKIAAKRIKRYPGRDALDIDQSFSAVEKVSDLGSDLSTQDRVDLKELESEEDPKDRLRRQLKIQPYDPELDSASSPQVKDSPPPDEPPEDLEDSDSREAVSIEEVKPLDYHTHWLTAGFGYIRNVAPTGGSYLFSSGNLRYGLSLAKLVFFDRPHLQDSLAAEGGFYLYKSIGYLVQGDSYTLLTLIGTLRYNLFFSESFGIFIYGGITQANVVDATQAQTSAVSHLNSILPAIGGGFLFQVGPSWYTRVDIGLESMTINLVLRF